MFLTYAALVLLAVLACAAVVSGWQEDQLFRQINRRLRDSAALLRSDVRDELTQGPNQEVQERIIRLGDQVNTRFTLVDRTGVVLADSKRNDLAAVAEMDNHASRKEFVKAKRSGEGYSRRNSSTVGIPYSYCALAVRKEGEFIGYVRAAQPLATALQEVADIRSLIWLVGTMVGCTGLAVTYLLTRRIVQPIQSLTAATENIVRGDFPLHIGVQSEDELGKLARSFEQMSNELSSRENQLRESNQRQRAVLGGMIEGVLAVDDKEHVLFANKMAGEILGFDADQVEDRGLMEVVRSNDLREIVQRAFATKMLVQGETEWKSDALLTLEVHATPLPGDPCPGVVLVLDDITELKRLEGLRQQFVANVNHELKTPLSAIKAYTETLMRGALDDKENAGRFLGRIDEQADRLNALILDMLALGRIEAGEAVFDLVNIPLSRVVGSCLADYETRAKAAQVTLQDEIGDCPLQVHADEESLLQILNNLLDNALKYTPANGSITLRCRKQDEEVLIEIADTGVGIAPEHHDRLFERFYRVDKARSRELGGTGLGLSIVKHLCQAMGGSVSVESTPNKGSTFRVCIPLAK